MVTFCRYRAPFVRAAPFIDRAPFLKHLHNLVISGFYARELDADDHEFLEYVRERGIANGSLPNTNAVLIEELDFWHLPYAIAPGIERKAGPAPPRPPETPEHRALREARSAAWHARRTIREQEKAIADAELERERRAWEKANETRKLRELLSDAEWEAAAPDKKKPVTLRLKPAKPKFGAVINRHYVPQWKLDELGIDAPIEPEKVWARESESEIREREAHERAARERAAHERAALDERRRRKIIEDARQTVERVTRLERGWREEREWKAAAYTSGYPSAESLKQAILTLIRVSPPHVWTRDELKLGVACTNGEFLDRCLDEMVRDGQLRKKAA